MLFLLDACLFVYFHRETRSENVCKISHCRPLKTNLKNVWNCVRTVWSCAVCVCLEFTQASKVVEVIQKGDLLKSLRSLRELQPWNAPLLLSHLYRSVHVYMYIYLLMFECIIYSEYVFSLQNLWETWRGGRSSIPAVLSHNPSLWHHGHGFTQPLPALFGQFSPVTGWTATVWPSYICIYIVTYTIICYFVFDQVVFLGLSSSARNSASGLAGTCAIPWCSTKAGHTHSWWTAQVEEKIIIKKGWAMRNLSCL